LTPRDFGVFGIATLVLSFLEIVTETGINIILVQKKENINEFINTAWVTSIIRGVLISIFIIVLTPFIAGFFNDTSAVLMLYVISVVPLIRGFINPSITKFIKDLEFKKEFMYRTSIFFVESVVSLGIVFYSQSVIGLAFGLICGAFFEVILSFIVVRPRPQFIFDKDKLFDVLGKGKWLTATGIFQYLYQNIDDVVVAKMVNVSTFGIYDMAYRISMLPITEISDVIGRVTFPVFVHMNTEIERLRTAFLKSFILTAAIVIPIGLIFYIFSKEIVLLLLGSQWIQASEILKVLALFGVIRALTQTAVPVLYAINKQDIMTKISILNFLIIAIVIFPTVSAYGVIGAAYAAVISHLLAVPYLIYVLKKSSIL
jgi:O-antigen/teichoic acid export membrane protein